jgi:hypothetical protein
VTGVRGNPDNPRRAAARKSTAAQARAEQGLREMIHANQQITFRGLTQTAGVSLDLLYRCAPIRRRVETPAGSPSRSGGVPAIPRPGRRRLS